METSKGKIFLANERGHLETDWFRSFQTFCFGQYQDQHKVPFSNLYVLNDETLAAGKALHYVIEESSLLILLPVVGAVSFSQHQADDIVLQAGEVGLFYACKGSEIKISNPLHQLVNYMQLWFRYSSPMKNVSPLSAFDIDSNGNQLVDLFSMGEIKERNFLKAAIGKFEGRKEAIYKTSSSLNTVFVFVIQGAFEVQNRLLEARDGLALWEHRKIEIEALSNQAILLLLEMGTGSL